MKTDTANEKLWQFEESSNDIDVIINTGSRLPCFISLDSSYKNEYRDKEQLLKDAELIVTAVNACKEINPDNPLKVAQMFSKIIEGLRQIADSTNGHILDKYDARGFVAIANLLLNQVTE